MRIEHIALYVKDLEAARDFLVTYLGDHSDAGYHNTSTDSRPFFISFDDGARSVGNKKLVDELTDRLRSDGFQLLAAPECSCTVKKHSKQN